jgi:hypothetical protein
MTAGGRLTTIRHVFQVIRIERVADKARVNSGYGAKFNPKDSRTFACSLRSLGANIGAGGPNKE